MNLTEAQRLVLTMRRNYLSICASIGPDTRPTLQELRAYGMPDDEACNRILDWDQPRADLHHTRNLTELDALTEILDATTITAPTGDQQQQAYTTRLANALEAVLDSPECEHGAYQVNDDTLTDAIAALHQHNGVPT